MNENTFEEKIIFNILFDENNNENVIYIVNKKLVNNN